MKRIFDVFISLVLLIACAPILIIICILIKLFMGRPIIFTQDRVGLRDRIFKIYKFRTMQYAQNCRSNNYSIQCIPTLGKYLRASGLDELLQIINVLKGDMSFIGPRPLMPEELIGLDCKERHVIRPGITGWAQVNGRSNISITDKLALDLWYIKNRSFWLDCKIIFITVRQLLHFKANL